MVNVSNSFVSQPPIDRGMLQSADLGTTLPTTALEELAAMFKANDHGAVGEDGLKINKTRSTTDIKRAGGATFRTVQTESDESIVVTCLEDDNVSVLDSVFGEQNVIVEAADADGQSKTIYHTSEPLPIKSWVLDAIDGQKTKRYVVEKGQVVNVAEVNDTHTDVTKYEITIKTYESLFGGTKGKNVVELRHDGALAVAAPGGGG